MGKRAALAGLASGSLAAAAIAETEAGVGDGAGGLAFPDSVGLAASLPFSSTAGVETDDSGAGSSASPLFDLSVGEAGSAESGDGTAGGEVGCSGGLLAGLVSVGSASAAGDTDGICGGAAMGAGAAAAFGPGGCGAPRLFRSPALNESAVPAEYVSGSFIVFVLTALSYSLVNLATSPRTVTSSSVSMESYP